jgi:aquaporin Z
MIRKLGAEFFGTFWLVLGGCGTAVITAAFASGGVGILGVALAFGLTVLTMAYALGHISGAHFNPAVTLGLWAGRRFPGKHVVPYVLAQVIGGIAAAAVLYVIASGTRGFSASSSGFASNGYGAHSPGGYSLAACFIAEFVLTLFFIFIIMGATHGRAPRGFAPLAIGLALTLIHLISIPITNTSVNPARSIAPAIFQGSWALSQLWMFIVAPLLGGAVGGVLYWVLVDRREPVAEEVPISGDAS